MSPILVEDIIYEIIKQLEYDESSLFNWLLVNKHWSNEAASYLCKNPFRFNKKSIKNYHRIIQTYITCFNEEERIGLNSHFKKIIIYNYQTPFFEYGKYLKEFKISELERSIKSWLGFIESMSSISFINHLHYFEFRTYLTYSLMRQC